MQYTRVTAAGVARTGGGHLNTISIAPTTATPTAGLITVYDNTAASGTVIFSEWVFATTPGHSIQLDCTVNTGIYVAYTTVDNVSVTVTHR